MGDRQRSSLPRPELERRLDAALTHRLTTITAADGFGKTTLLDRWGGAVGAVRHRLTAADRDLGRFVGNVVAALRLRAPGVTAELGRALSAPVGPKAAGADEDAAADARATALAGALSDTLDRELHRDLILTLDDLDVLDDGSPAARFLDALLRSAPHRFHLVTASRSEPPFAVARLREQQQLFELTAAELALDASETHSWARSVLGEDGEDLADAIHAHTAGWPAAVIATLRQLATAPADQRRAALAGSVRIAALDDLTAGVYRDQPAPVRQLLRAGTVVPSLTPDLAELLCGPDLPGGARELLAATERATPLLEQDPGEPDTYRLTPTARAAVRRHDPLDPDLAEHLAETAARWELGRDRPERALRVLTDAGASEPLAQLLRAHAHHLMAPDLAEDVLEALSILPDTVRGDPELQRLAGIAHLARGRWDEARAILGEVAEGPAFDAAVAWRLGLVHHLRGELDTALAIYDRGAAAGSPPADAAISAASAASAAWLRGDRDGCATRADDALARATALRDDRALAAAHMVQAMLAAFDGDRRANDAHYLRAIEHAERAADAVQLIRIRSNRASHHLEEGAYTDALAELEIARRLADLTGFTPFAAMTLSNRAEALLRLGRLEEAASDAADAAAAWRSLGSQLVVYGLEQQARVLQLRGQTAAAEQLYRTALAAAEDAGDAQGLVPSLVGLAELLLDEDVEEAAQLADRAVALGRGMGTVMAQLAAARVAVRTGARQEARSHLDRARTEATERRDRPALAAVAELEAELTGDAHRAEEAIARWREVGDVVGLARAELLRGELTGDEAAARAADAARERLHAIGCRLLDDRIGAALQRSAPDGPAWVRVETLGSFRVLRDGAPIARGAWQSRKARDLIKLLASRRGRPARRDWLTDQLWPDVDPDTAAKRLNVMTSTVRSVIDPDRTHGADAVIASDRDTLQLDLTQVELDVDRFLADVESATALDREGRTTDALAHWRRAESAYTGDFCEDEPYADWAIGLREEARAAYGQTVARLATVATDDARHDESVRLWLRLLERDPFDERAHLALVRSLLAAGRIGDARRRYLTYVQRIRELGVEPVPIPSS